VPPEAGRGRERSEPGNHRDFPAVLRTAPPRHFVPLPHSANRFVGENPLPQRQGRPTPLPRGAAAERGSTAGGGEGARAKRARKSPWFPCGPTVRAPSALRATPPLR